MNKELIIELRGVEFVNKGAELMLRAIVAKIEEQFPNAIFVMENRIGLSPRQVLLKNNIYSKTNFKFKRYNKLHFFLDASYITNFFSPSKRRSMKYVSEEEINVVIDGSGFAFGDQWGANYAAKVLTSHIEKWKSSNKTVILLPQAFGPFEKIDLRNEMGKVVKNADLIYARDPISYEYIKGLDEGNSRIRLSPDFTSLIKGIIPDYFDSSLHQVAVVPNNKMITSNNQEKANAYLDLLVKSILYIQRKGFKPFFLIHEGKGDLALAEKINKDLSIKIPIIVDDNSLVIKGIIGACYAIITARFHGLVSALSQGIPCLATGWSHKYEMLLSDYSYPEALIDVNIGEPELESKIENILNIDSREAITQKLKDASVKQKSLSISMWNEVFDKLSTIKN